MDVIGEILENLLKAVVSAIAAPVKFVWENVPGGQWILGVCATILLSGTGFVLVWEDDIPKRDTGTLIEKAKAAIDENGDGKPDFSVKDLNKPEKILPPMLALVSGELQSYGLDSEKMSAEIRKNPEAFRVALPEKLGLIHRKRFIALTPDDENLIADKTAREIADSGKLYRDEVAETRLQAIAEKIIAQLPSPFPVKIFLLRDNTANAFALPNGNVYVHSGLLERVNSDDALAHILACEYAHVLGRYSAEAFTKLLFLWAGDVFAENLANKWKEEDGLVAKGVILRMLYLGGGNLGVLKPFRNMYKKETDILGSRYMIRAGFNPDAAIAFYEASAAETKSEGSAWSEFFSTHSSPEERAERLRDESKKLGRNMKPTFLNKQSS